MSAKKKPATTKFFVLFDMTGSFGIEVSAASLEEAVAAACVMPFRKALDAFIASGVCWDEYEGRVTSAWEIK